MTFGSAAELFEISLSYLNQLMRGESHPSLDMLITITQKLGVEPNTLLYDGDPAKRPLSRAEVIERLVAALPSLEDENLRSTLDFIGQFPSQRAETESASS